SVTDLEPTANRRRSGQRSGMMAANSATAPAVRVAEATPARWGDASAVPGIRGDASQCRRQFLLLRATARKRSTAADNQDVYHLSFHFHQSKRSRSGSAVRAA